MAKSKMESGEEHHPKVSQATMVKSALTELGTDAKPQAIQDHIQSKFNTNLSKGIISNYKSTLKRKGQLGDTPVVSNGRGRPRLGAGPLRVDDIETVTSLVTRLGADQVRRLIEVLA